jgi:hypothetical protein
MTMRAVLGLIAIVGSTWGMAHEQNNVHHQGTVSGYDFNEYHLQLIKGNRLTADLENPKLDATLFKPIENINQW